MKKRMIALMLVLSVLLCGCGGDAPKASSGAPGRMVQIIEVAIHPQDPEFARVYETQENMNDLLALLRSMQTNDVPAEEPDIEGGQSLFTVTVTFANGQQSVYYLLGRTYLRLGDNPWCTITLEQSMRFTDFIHTHPSDDGSAETTQPTE